MRGENEVRTKSIDLNFSRRKKRSQYIFIRIDGSSLTAWARAKQNYAVAKIRTLILIRKSEKYKQRIWESHIPHSIDNLERNRNPISLHHEHTKQTFHLRRL